MNISSNFTTNSTINSNLDDNHNGIPGYVFIIVGVCIIFSSLVSSCNYCIDNKIREDDKKKEKQVSIIIFLFFLGITFIIGGALSE